MQNKTVIGQSIYHRRAPAKTSQAANPPVSAYCPITHKWTVVTKRKAYFSIPGGQARWWYCEECQGWHIMIKQEDQITSVSPWKFRPTGGSLSS